MPGIGLHSINTIPFLIKLSLKLVRILAQGLPWSHKGRERVVSCNLHPGPALPPHIISYWFYAVSPLWFYTNQQPALLVISVSTTGKIKVTARLQYSAER